MNGSARSGSRRWPTATGSPTGSGPWLPDGVDAFIDLFGEEYVRLAVELGVDA